MYRLYLNEVFGVVGGTWRQVDHDGVGRFVNGSIEEAMAAAATIARGLGATSYRLVQGGYTVAFSRWWC
jgi:hypothetical protein